MWSMKNKERLDLRTSLIFIVLIMALISPGCGGNSDSDSSNNLSSGIFLDSAVEGLEYKTDSLSGITDKNGTFYYSKGEDITFSIGGINLGKTRAGSIITPVDLVPGATNEDHPDAIKIARFLQTMDEDNDLTNGIKISEGARNLAKEKDIDFLTIEESTLQDIVDDLSEESRTLVTVEDAKSHLVDSLCKASILGEWKANIRGGYYFGPNFYSDIYGIGSYILNTDNTWKGLWKFNSTFMVNNSLENGITVFPIENGTWHLDHNGHFTGTGYGTASIERITTVYSKLAYELTITGSLSDREINGSWRIEFKDTLFAPFEGTICAARFDYPQTPSTDLNGEYDIKMKLDDNCHINPYEMRDTVTINQMENSLKLTFASTGESINGIISKNKFVFDGEKSQDGGRVSLVMFGSVSGNSNETECEFVWLWHDDDSIDTCGGTSEVQMIRRKKSPVNVNGNWEFHFMYEDGEKFNDFFNIDQSASNLNLTLPCYPDIDIEANINGTNFSFSISNEIIRNYANFSGTVRGDIIEGFGEMDGESVTWNAEKMNREITPKDCVISSVYAIAECINYEIREITAYIDDNESIIESASIHGNQIFGTFQRHEESPWENWSCTISYDEGDVLPELPIPYSVHITFTDGDTLVISKTIYSCPSIDEVNNKPIASNLSKSTTEDTPVDITLTASDPDWDDLTWHIDSQPMHGTLSGTAPSMTYIPDTGFTGSDSFTFHVNDGSEDSSIATVNITVTSQDNDLNVTGTWEGTWVSSSYGLSGTFTATITQQGSTLSGSIEVPEIGMYDAELKGTATGTTIVFGDIEEQITFTGTVIEGSTASGTYTFPSLYDNGTWQGTKEAVSCNNKPIASNLSKSTTEDTSIDITLSASDPDGDDLTWHMDSQPAHGTLSGTAPLMTYTPDTGFTGSDSFTFYVNDGSEDSSIATVNITVTSQNADLNVAGTWEGTWVSSGYGLSGTFIVTITQQGSTLSGSIEVPEIDMYGAELKGTATGTTIVFGDIEEQITFTGTVSDGLTASGTYTYPSLYDNGTWQGIKEVISNNKTTSCNTPGYAWSLSINGNYAYVADGDSGLQIIDISDPNNPGIVGSCDTPGYAWGVCISGNYAYVADGDSGLQIIDISAPDNPGIVGSCDTSDNAWGVSISGNYTYVADWDSGLQIIDISDPNNPYIVGFCDTPDYAWGVAINGNYAYVADGNSGLHVIDISDPNNPGIVGSCDTQGDTSGVSISGNYAYVADWDSGLQVIDISDPNNPGIVGSCDTPGFAWSVCINGNYAYVADDDSGLQIIDISAPDNPGIVGSFDTQGDASGVSISGNYAYVADGDSGLQIIDIEKIKTLTNITYLKSVRQPKFRYK